MKSFTKNYQQGYVNSLKNRQAGLLNTELGRSWKWICGQRLGWEYYITPWQNRSRACFAIPIFDRSVGRKSSWWFLWR